MKNHFTNTSVKIVDIIPGPSPPNNELTTIASEATKKGTWRPIKSDNTNLIPMIMKLTITASKYR